MYKEDELYKPDFEKSSGWIFQANGRRLYPAIGAWGKEYCARHPGCYYRDARAIEAERAAREVGLLLRRSSDFAAVTVPQDVTRMLEELNRNGERAEEYTLPENNTNRARVIGTHETEQPEWYTEKRAEKNREWNYTRMIRAIGYDTHYFNCNELIRSGIYECKHFDCKCPCHNNNTARAVCLWLTKRGDAHNDCKCACHLSA